MPDRSSTSPGRPARAVSLPVETDAVEATEALGRQIGTDLNSGDVLALYGDLGAGKTHFVKGICAAFGVPPEQVTSPTFTLVNEYDGAAFPIYHIDAYRLRSLDEFFELGYEEYLFGNGLCLIEWPEKVEPLLPPYTLRLRLTHLGGDRRRVDWLDEG